MAVVLEERFDGLPVELGLVGQVGEGVISYVGSDNAIYQGGRGRRVVCLLGGKYGCGRRGRGRVAGIIVDDN